MSRVEGLAEIVLWVADMESALEFYQDRFGLELMSPPQMPNKFLMVAKPGGSPELIVLVPHPHPDSYFPSHKEKEMRSLHHLASRARTHEYAELETEFIERGIGVREWTRQVYNEVRTRSVDNSHGN